MLKFDIGGEMKNGLLHLELRFCNSPLWIDDTDLFCARGASLGENVAFESASDLGLQSLLHKALQFPYFAVLKWMVQGLGARIQ